LPPDPEEAIMAVDEMLTALRRDLERDYGVEATSYLMDRPRGGWDELVTKETLALELRAAVAELRTDLAKELNRQTWRLATLVVAAQGIAVGALAAIRFS
jgi:hypothetical protein